jgi:hypothetical protein
MPLAVSVAVVNFSVSSWAKENRLMHTSMPVRRIRFIDKKDFVIVSVV